MRLHEPGVWMTKFTAGVHSLFLVVLANACGTSRDSDLFGPDDGPGITDANVESGVGDGASGGDGQGPGGGPGDGGDGPLLDVGHGGNSGGQEGGGCETEGCECVVGEHQPCDSASQDPLQAIGLNCPGEMMVQGATMGSASAIGVRKSFGGTDAFAPREGEQYLVLGSGRVDELDSETPNSDGEFDHDDPTYCNDDLGPFDTNTLPAPLNPKNVGAQTCDADPSLIGTGDCSNTLQQEWDDAMAGGCTINGIPCPIANDYTELRFTAQVPASATSLSYNLAFMTTEWPAYFDTQYNDFYVGWLESEQWTGNISFDQDGNPISLNAAFFNYLDHNGTLPELAGTCMRYHGATEWLTTTAPVSPGEMVTLVFAIFDLSDSILDSYVFLDNFQWGCEGGVPPQTVPQG